jgi:hypothetical protein
MPVRCDEKMTSREGWKALCFRTQKGPAGKVSVSDVECSTRRTAEKCHRRPIAMERLAHPTAASQQRMASLCTSCKGFFISRNANPVWKLLIALSWPNIRDWVNHTSVPLLSFAVNQINSPDNKYWLMKKGTRRCPFLFSDAGLHEAEFPVCSFDALLPLTGLHVIALL